MYSRTEDTQTEAKVKKKAIPDQNIIHKNTLQRLGMSTVK